MPNVSLYVRHKSDRYEKCSSKAVYVLGTQFVLRHELEGRRRWEKLPSGIDYVAAKGMALEKELALYRGETPEKAQEKGAPPPPKLKIAVVPMLDQAIDQYLKVVKTKSARTFFGYTYTMKRFYAVVGNMPLGAVTKQHLYDYLAAMKKKGLGDRTWHNRCAEVSIMLRFHGVNVSIKVRYTLRAYRDDELQKLFAAADSDDHLQFSFFLATGAREQEVMYATWSDVDLEDGVFTVGPSGIWVRAQGPGNEGNPVPAAVFDLPTVRLFAEKSTCPPTLGCESRSRASSRPVGLNWYCKY